ncbi:MAG: alpha/beta hydrolase [Deltaproteobacteria bacterium]|nr:alpha/beta hydrolase [Deltaproteobacteria bacterium]MBT7156049.1 alpha/beta hydrolase [Deltaproteobacteria bacterium]
MKTNNRMIKTNGINLNILEQGEGPLVIMCHGFPELAHSWRHQVSALADAGYHAVAPDQRGYGKSDSPEGIDPYHILNLVGDMVGLVDALGEEKAVIVGHDFGSMVAIHCALLRPDIFHAVTLMSVPYTPRHWGSTSPVESMRQMAGENEFYIAYFQEPGRVEKELEANVRENVMKTFYSLSGDAAPDKRWRFIFKKGERFTDTSYLPDSLPAWLTEEDIDFFAREFERTGYGAAVNWYRNWDRNWELTPFLTGAKIEQPSLFIAGGEDSVVAMMGPAIENQEASMTDLRKKVMIPGAGHWVQQERPQEVNKLLIDFLNGL